MFQVCVSRLAVEEKEQDADEERGDHVRDPVEECTDPIKHGIPSLRSCAVLVFFYNRVAYKCVIYVADH